MTPRQELRRLIGQTGYTMVPGAYDTLTARLILFQKCWCWT